jgi:acetylornithine deacetylase/succinyl-diaminopimelate desuccinylase-like protein
VPGTSVDAIQSAFTAVVADPAVTVRLTHPPVPSPPSPLRPDVMSAITRITGEFWKNAVVVPGMSTGATDGLYLRNAGVPVYGVSAILMDPAEERAHGLDERVPVKSLYDAREFWYRLVKALTAAR